MVHRISETLTVGVSFPEGVLTKNDKHPAPMAEETNVKTAAPVDPSVSMELDHVKNMERLGILES